MRFKGEAKDFRYVVYVRHGDICGCDKFADCALGKPDTFEAVAAFAFLPEALAASQRFANLGIKVAMRTRNFGNGSDWYRGPVFDSALVPSN